MIRCKMMCTHIELDGNNTGTVKFSAQYDPTVCEEDLGFQIATPWGEVEFQIDNPNAIAQLAVGEQYYFDISKVPSNKD